MREHGRNIKVVVGCEAEITFHYTLFPLLRSITLIEQSVTLKDHYYVKLITAV